MGDANIFRYLVVLQRIVQKNNDDVVWCDVKDRTQENTEKVNDSSSTYNHFFLLPPFFPHWGKDLLEILL